MSSPPLMRSLILDLIRPALHSSSLSPTEISDDFNLVDSGLLDSIAFLQLIAELESHLEITLELFDVDPDRLTTLGGLMEILQSAQLNFPPPRDIRTG